MKTIVLGVLGLTACYEASQTFVERQVFSEVLGLGAFPAAKGPDGWHRVCDGGPVDGLLTDFVLTSSARANRDETALRPGDVVNLRLVEGGGRDDVSVTRPGDVTIVDATVSPFGTRDHEALELLSDPASFVANNAERGIGHNVLLLIEQTASMNGGAGQVVSDPLDHRLTIAQGMRQMMRPRDRFGVLAFNELGLHVPCAANDLATCFGSDPEVWTEGIEALRGSAMGRSGLWRAVSVGFEMMRDTLGDEARSNHIIVLTDGPDDCAGEQRDACAAGCTTADYDMLAAEVRANGASTRPIRLHFVQIDTQGEPDARQLELSCLSGGYYQAVPATGAADSLHERIGGWLTRVLTSFPGHWQVGATVPDYTALPGGALYSLFAMVRLAPQTNLVPEIYQTSVGSRLSDGTTLFRKPCVLTDCGASTPCHVGCSSETRLCSDADLPDLATCGEGGFCCDGECRLSGTCESCSSP